MYRQIEESQTLLINTQSKDLELQKKKIIKFGFGQSPFMPPKLVLEALKSSVNHKEYTSVQSLSSPCSPSAFKIIYPSCLCIHLFTKEVTIVVHIRNS